MIRIMIPARLESTRLPQKLLLAESGKRLIRHTIEAAMKTGYQIIVAHDSIELNKAGMMHTPAYGGKLHFQETRNCRSGTDRIAQAIGLWNEDDDRSPINDDDVIINWQADEPMIHFGLISALLAQFATYPSCDIATLATALEHEDNEREQVVKLSIIGSCGIGTFSRSPFIGGNYRHIGIYAYRAGFVRWFASQDQAKSEKRNRLEQLRALALGCRIHVAVVDHLHYGIDTREDYDRFLKALNVKEWLA